MLLSVKVLRALKVVPVRHRDDALQEAYLAVLTDKEPLCAVQNYWKKEWLHEHREQTAQARARLPREHLILDNTYAAKIWLDEVHGGRRRDIEYSTDTAQEPAALHTRKDDSNPQAA